MVKLTWLLINYKNALKLMKIKSLGKSDFMNNLVWSALMRLEHICILLVI